MLTKISFVFKISMNIIPYLCNISWKKKQRKTRKLLNNTAHIVPNTTINIKCIKNRVSWYFLQNCPFYVICWILQFAKENIAFAKMSIMLLIRIPELTVTANIDAQCFATTLTIFSQKYATRVLRTFLFLVEKHKSKPI